MIRSFVIGKVFLVCGVLAATPPSWAQIADATRVASDISGQDLWWEHGWGFAGPGVYREQNPTVRRRLAGLFHLDHSEAAAQSCGEVAVSEEVAERLFTGDPLGPFSSGERVFVADRQSHLAGRLAALAGGEACEWAYENYGPNGAMQPGLIRSKYPETTSSLSPSR